MMQTSPLVCREAGARIQTEDRFIASARTAFGRLVGRLEIDLGRVVVWWRTIARDHAALVFTAEIATSLDRVVVAFGRVLDWPDGQELGLPATGMCPVSNGALRSEVFGVGRWLQGMWHRVVLGPELPDADLDDAHRQAWVELARVLHEATSRAYWLAAELPPAPGAGA